MYIVLELQVNGNSVSNIVTSHEDSLEAESHFHSVLSAAAISSVEKHSAILLDDDGSVLRNECYKHSREQEEVSVE